MHTATIVAVVAAVAAVLSNVDDIIAFHTKYIAPAFYGQTNVTVSFEEWPTQQPVLLRFKDVDETDNDPVRRTLLPGKDYVFELRRNREFDVSWTGAGYAAGKQSLPTTSDSIVVRLVPVATENDGPAGLQLEYIDTGAVLPTGEAERATEVFEPRRTMLQIASATPEFDRAQAIIGLFEMGTPECARSYVVNSFGVNVGCEGIPLNSIVHQMEEAHKLEFLETLALSGLREVAENMVPRNRLSADQLRILSEAMDPLSRNLMFWASYDQVSKSFYDWAVGLALNAGLRTEREILLVYRAVVRTGAVQVRRRLSTLDTGKKYQEADLSTRLGLLRTAMDTTMSPGMRGVPVIKASNDLLQFGEVEFNNVQWRLSDFGVPDGTLDQSIQVEARVFGGN
ncbi:hypothetical protein [uncultured Tateyamaria sp.]|uniref:hypothetical protein n=1 Tax=uncultured Tateyamaria sp. TaxID=455651 RepID=UPI00260E5131|nr:hypothetical protein [uncultured Tateyamaria sp.]